MSQEELELPPSRMLEPADVGHLVVGAMGRGDLYVITHPEVLPAVDARHAAIHAAFEQAAAREASAGEENA